MADRRQSLAHAEPHHRRRQTGRWDGDVLTWIDEKIHALGDFAETNWKHPTTVEIAAATKTLGWFFHAHTNMEWLVRLIFRVGKNTFKQEDLNRKLGLPTLNDTPGIEVYSNEPRVHVANRKGPWQEVWMLIHKLDEIDTPAFDEFLRKAVGSFGNTLKRMNTKPEDVMPWKVNGETLAPRAKRAFRRAASCSMGPRDLAALARHCCARWSRSWRSRWDNRRHDQRACAGGDAGVGAICAPRNRMRCIAASSARRGSST